MNGKVLVIVRSVDEVELARAFVLALGDTRFLLLFAQEDLRTRFGETDHPSSVDFASLFVQDPTEIRLAVCFSGPRELGPSTNLLPLAYLNELGVVTLEIQRDLLQDCVSAQSQSTAQHFWAWSGSSGTGNLRALLPSAESTFVRDDVVLVSSRLDGDAYSEEERHRFVFAVLRLARENPSSCFIWRPSTSELQQADVAPLLAVIEKLGPDNLFLEENESFGALLARSSAALSMASNTLFDCAEIQKPALVFLGGTSDVLPYLRAQTFCSYEELTRHWSELRAQPARFSIESELPPVDAARLQKRAEELAASSAMVSDWLPIALRYASYWQQTRVRADIGRLQGSITSLEKRVVGLREDLEGGVEKRLDKLLDRIGVLQRSTIAYKAARLLTRVRRRPLKH